MHGHEVLPEWYYASLDWAMLLLVLLVVYMFISMVLGCPYCMLPNLSWPVDLTRAVWARATREDT